MTDTLANWDIVERLRSNAPRVRSLDFSRDAPDALMEEAADEIERLRRSPSPDVAVVEALKLAVKHIEHMAAWITERNQNARSQYGTYSFESLGEDMPGIRAALSSISSGTVMADDKVNREPYADDYPTALKPVASFTTNSTSPWNSMAVPDGWKLVPIEPTGEMVNASRGALKEYIESVPEADRPARWGHDKPRNGWNVSWREKARARYRAMLSAAPNIEEKDKCSG